jgi:hypothetical protein
MFRKLSEHEFKYCWYIEYGEPYHYIPTPPKIGECIKTLISDEICIQLPNPTLEKSPLYTRFTREGRILFLAHEWLMMFRHPSELADGMTYDVMVDGYDFQNICENLTGRLSVLSVGAGLFGE